MRYLIFIVTILVSFSAYPINVDDVIKTPLSRVIDVTSAEKDTLNFFSQEIRNDVKLSDTKPDNDIIDKYENEIESWSKSQIRKLGDDYKKKKKNTPKEQHKDLKKQYNVGAKKLKKHRESLHNDLEKLEKKQNVEAARNLAASTFLAPSDKNNDRLISAISKTLADDPSIYEHKRNFRLRGEISENISWMVYDIIDSNNEVVLYGHAIVFDRKFNELLKSVGAPTSSIQWAGYTTYLEKLEMQEKWKKYSISEKLFLGSDLETLKDGLSKKFGVSPQLIKFREDCMSMIYRSNSLPIYTFLPKIMEWAGTDIMNQVSPKYPWLNTIKLCQDVSNFRDGNISVDISLLDEMITFLQVTQTHTNKLISNDAFLNTAKNKWGEPTGLIEQMNGLELKYPVLYVAMSRDTNSNSTKVVYRIDTDLLRPTQYHSYSTTMFTSAVRTNLPFQIIESAYDLERFVSEIKAIKETKQTSDFEL